MWRVTHSIIRRKIGFFLRNTPSLLVFFCSLGWCNKKIYWQLSLISFCDYFTAFTNLHQQLSDNCFFLLLLSSFIDNYCLRYSLSAFWIHFDVHIKSSNNSKVIGDLIEDYYGQHEKIIDKWKIFCIEKGNQCHKPVCVYDWYSEKNNEL